MRVCAAATAAVPAAALIVMAASSSSSASANGRAAFSMIAPRRRSSAETCAGTILSAAASSSSGGGGGGIQRPTNEFSRTYRIDSIFGQGGGMGSSLSSSRRGSGGRRREYVVRIEADEREREALAKRFRLSEIARLEADLAIREDDKRGAAFKVECVQVEGNIRATVTQKCVRTNEDFGVDLEFDVASLVKAAEPMTSSSASAKVGLGGMDASDIERQIGNRNGSGGGGGGSKNKSGRNNKKGKRGQKDGNYSVGRRGGSIGSRSGRMKIDDVGMLTLEDMLREYDSDMARGGHLFDDNDDVVEDEAVLGPNGVLDIGELVAQLFRLKLDPYPKKPGSKPINLSFSG